MKSTLKVAFITSEDPFNRITQSGIAFQMLNALKNNFIQVTPVGPIYKNRYFFLFLRAAKRIIETLSARRYHIGHSLLLSRYYAYMIKKKLKEHDFDLIFAHGVACEIACLKTGLPLIFSSDSTFNQLRDYYSYYTGLSTIAVIESNLLEKKALVNADILIHSSRWAADYVKTYYKVRDKFAFILPMGANIDHAPDPGVIEQKLTGLKSCHLIFIGVDWERKGGGIAFEALIELNKAGIDTHLTICGCIPPPGFSHPKLKVYPFLNKNIPGDYAIFHDLLIQAHFLIFPSRAECQGVAICEASAYGIPTIGADTGGISGVLENGVNGFLLPMHARGKEYANLIQDVFLNEHAYRRLVIQSREKYEKELNWQAWGESVKKITQTQINRSIKEP